MYEVVHDLRRASLHGYEIIEPNDDDEEIEADNKQEEPKNTTTQTRFNKSVQELKQYFEFYGKPKPVTNDKETLQPIASYLLK